VIGVWITGQDGMENKNLWATCARLVICEEALGTTIKSSS